MWMDISNSIIYYRYDTILAPLQEDGIPEDTPAYQASSKILLEFSFYLFDCVIFVLPESEGSYIFIS